MPVAFDNRKRAISYRISSFLLTIAVIILITLIFFSNLVPKTGTVVNRKTATILVIGLYLLFGFYRYWLDLYYFYFSDVSNRLIFRYYSLRPFQKLKRSIEIPKESFYSFQIRKDVTGLKPSLILAQKTLEGIKSYPPIRISGLSRHEIKRLAEVLNKYKNATAGQQSYI